MTIMFASSLNWNLYVLILALIYLLKPCFHLKVIFIVLCCGNWISVCLPGCEWSQSFHNTSHKYRYIFIVCVEIWMIHANWLILFLFYLNRNCFQGSDSLFDLRKGRLPAWLLIVIPGVKNLNLRTLQLRPKEEWI